MMPAHHNASRPAAAPVPQPASMYVRLLCVVAACVVACGLVAANAAGNHYHTNCVPHGFVHGSSTTDNQFHSRVEAGCNNPGTKRCDLHYTEGPAGPTGSVPAGINATCNTFSNGGWGEQASYAITDFNGIFTVHNHFPH